MGAFKQYRSSFKEIKKRRTKSSVIGGLIVYGSRQILAQKYCSTVHVVKSCYFFFFAIFLFLFLRFCFSSAVRTDPFFFFSSEIHLDTQEPQLIFFKKKKQKAGKDEIKEDNRRGWGGHY